MVRALVESLQSSLQDRKIAFDAFAGIAAALCAIAAFRLRARPRMAAWLVALSGTVIALAMSMDDFLHAWDERYHAVVARHSRSTRSCPRCMSRRRCRWPRCGEAATSGFTSRHFPCG